MDRGRSTHPVHTQTHGLEGYLEIGTDGRVDPQWPQGHLSLRVDRLRSGNDTEGEAAATHQRPTLPTIDGDLTDIVPADGRLSCAGSHVSGVTNEHRDKMFIHFDDDTVTLAGTAFDVAPSAWSRPDPPVAVEPEVTFA